MSFDECHAAWPYSEKMQRLIHAMKYEGKPSIARLLAKGISSRVHHLNLSSRENVVIVPVPMHSRRQRERGYNQSALIAFELAALWNLPVNSKSLYRIRDTPPQALLSGDERLQNVQDAFRVQPATVFVSWDILLVDDVVTTGSTIDACAQALKMNGARCVYIVAAAHA
jgi:ComF family protein